MQNVMNSDGKTININTFIDIEPGFYDISLSQADGGCLYVPGGENVGEKAGRIIKSTRNGIIVLSQDFHPSNHISFMTNHPGAMEYRINSLNAMGKSEQEALSPLTIPFSEIVLAKDGNIIGFKDGNQVRKVQLDTEYPSAEYRGRVQKVLDEYLPQSFWELRNVGCSTQMLWSPHCQQGTKSANFDERLGLPKELVTRLHGDWLSKDIEFFDKETGNNYFVIRKGMNSEVDSYGLGVENDKRTLTTAFQVFTRIADMCVERGVEKVNINEGGLATNFCVEFSVNNTHDLITGLFRIRGIQTQVNLITDICSGIPIPGGVDQPFSLEGAPLRMEKCREGTGMIRSESLITPSATIKGDLNAEHGREQQRKA